MKVFVYFNLHKKLFSVRALEGKSKGKVVAHLPSLWLDTPEFKVSKAGRQRVLREQVKNVHAGVAGYWEDESSLYLAGLTWHKIRYNPYLFDSFVDHTEKPIWFADVAKLCVNNNKPILEAGVYEGAYDGS